MHAWAEAQPSPLPLTLILSHSRRESMLSMHEPMLSLSILVLEPNPPDLPILSFSPRQVGSVSVPYHPVSCQVESMHGYSVLCQPVSSQIHVKRRPYRGVSSPACVHAQLVCAMLAPPCMQCLYLRCGRIECVQFSKVVGSVASGLFFGWSSVG